IGNLFRNGRNGCPEHAWKLEDLNLLIPIWFCFPPRDNFICNASLLDQGLERWLCLDRNRSCLRTNESGVSNELNGVAETVQAPNQHAPVPERLSIPKPMRIRDASSR